MEELNKEQVDNPEEEPQKDEETDSSPEIRIRRLSKSNYNKILFGVCGGLGEYFSIEPVFFRLMFLFSILMGGWGIIFYLIAALLMPRSNDDAEIDENALEAIKKSNNVSLIAGVVLLAGLYIIFDDLGYFDFLTRIGIPSEFVLVLITGVIIFSVFFMCPVVNEEKVLPEKFVRTGNNALFGGICSGLAEYLGVSAVSIRLIAVFLSFITLGFPVLIYLFFLAAVPKENKIEI